jgi:hypothetical protein
MAGRSRARSYLFTPIAATGDGRVSDFRPYVASIADDGTVAFQAALTAGGSGVFSGDGALLVCHADPFGGTVREIVSHPDIDRAGSISVYAELASGVRGVYELRDGALIAVAETGAYAAIGPLGPTMNAGTIAFRGRTLAGAEGIFIGDQDAVTAVAETGASVSAFHGLPVACGTGAVVYRADRPGGGQGIYRWSDGRVGTVAETGGRFAELGRFPAANAAGQIVFCATLTSGGAGVFAVDRGEPALVVDTRAPFESVRGALIDDHGTVVFYATPRGGRLGIYAGPDPVADRILGVGDSHAGASIAAFALNPVSINTRGQLAIRLELDDGRQLIVRADPT